MEPTNNATRRDVIQNAVSHQIQELEGSGRSRRALATLFSSELNHAPQQVQAILERLGPETRVEPALTDSGTYRGSVVVETAHELIQRISPQYAVIHRKDDLDSRPRIGDHVCISYSDGDGHVRKVREKNRTKELAR